MRYPSVAAKAGIMEKWATPDPWGLCGARVLQQKTTARGSGQHRIHGARKLVWHPGVAAKEDIMEKWATPDPWGLLLSETITGG